MRPIRVLLGKAGMDGHDRGIKVVARILRDAGCEVIYTGLYQTPEAIVNAAIQEDVDASGLSVLSAAHKHLFSETARLMREHGLEDVVLFGGGIIPPKDVAWLEQHGVQRIFLPGASGPEIVDFVRQAVKERRAL
jgi:methylmalonyl-CoA mutase C-terminal domain/subunit